MNLLIQKLRDGETEFQDGPEEGQLVPIKRAPTRTALRAAKAIETLSSSLDNLGASYNALMSQYNHLMELYTKCLQSIHELTENSQAGVPTPTQETTNSQGTPLEPNSDQTTNNQS